MPETLLPSSRDVPICPRDEGGTLSELYPCIVVRKKADPRQ